MSFWKKDGFLCFCAFDPSVAVAVAVGPPVDDVLPDSGVDEGAPGWPLPSRYFGLADDVVAAVA